MADKLKFKKDDIIVMMGDSVTDVERARPHGEGLFNPYGIGYVAYVNALFQAHYPGLRLRFINKGNSGNNVRDLAARWKEDVTELKPDWVSIMIGINDVWRQFDTPFIPGKDVKPSEYEKTLDKLVKKTLPTVKGMVLMTPYYIEPNEKDLMRARMDEYGAIVRKLAKKYKTMFVDTQQAWSEILKSHHSSFIAWDRVHPNNSGHMILARSWCNAVGFEWQK